MEDKRGGGRVGKVAESGTLREKREGVSECSQRTKHTLVCPKPKIMEPASYERQIVPSLFSSQHRQFLSLVQKFQVFNHSRPNKYNCRFVQLFSVLVTHLLAGATYERDVSMDPNFTTYHHYIFISESNEKKS